MKIPLASMFAVLTAIHQALGAPAEPAGVVASPLNGRVWLEWTHVSGADTYTVKRSDTVGGPYFPVATGITGLTFNDFTAINGSKYFYVVAGLEGAEEGPDSEEVSAVPEAY